MPVWTALLRHCLPKLCLNPPEDLRPRVARYVRALLYLFNIHTLLLGFLACIAVYVCDRYRFSYNMDLTLVATGTTFPLIFNIQQAFTRREKALTLIANLKASAVGLYFMHRDWAQDEDFPASLGKDHSVSAQHCKMLLLDLLKDVRAYLVASSPWESYAEQRLQIKHHPYMNMLMADMSLSGTSQLSFAAAVESAQKTDPAAAALRRCYRGFSRLSVLNERLGLRSGYTRGGEGGMSRTNQYLRYIISNLEELRMIKEYRTPIMMRYANGVLLHIFAIFLAPYFVHFCDSWTSYGYSRDSCPAGYSAAIVFVVIVLLLYHVQQDIENPFDMNGLDDVFFDVGSEVMDDVMLNTLTTTTAAASGWTTPRQPAVSIPEVHGSSAAVGSFNGRCPAELPSVAPRAGQQVSQLLQPVSEGWEGSSDDRCGADLFATVGFAGPAAHTAQVSNQLNPVMSAPDEILTVLSKQKQQHWSSCEISAHGPCSNCSTTSCSEAAETGAGVQTSSSSNIERLQAGGISSPPRLSGNAIAEAGEIQLGATAGHRSSHYQPTQGFIPSPSNHRENTTPDREHAGRHSRFHHFSHEGLELRRSNSSSDSMQGLIKASHDSSSDWR